MSLMKEFREFAMRGNVVDMAVGVIIGTSFGKITTSLVSDVIMPPIGIMLSQVDFKNLKIDLGASGAGGEPVAIKYGMFLTTIIDFILVALVVFFIVKSVNTLRKYEDGTSKAVPTTKKCSECLSIIPIDAKRCLYCTSTVEARAR